MVGNVAAADPRVRRSQPPRTIAEEMAAFEDQRPRMRKISVGGLDLFYRVTSWNDLGRALRGHGAEDADLRIRERSLHCVLVVDEEVVGYAHFREHSVGTWVTDMDYWEACDANSDHAAAMAETVLAGWGIERVSVYGLVVEFAQLWVSKRHARVSAWAGPVRALIERRWVRRGATQAGLMILKPFPFEYAGQVGEEPTVLTELRLKTRIAAMRRLYRRLLGVRPLHDGEHMWRSLAGRVNPPSRKPRRLRRAY